MDLLSVKGTEGTYGFHAVLQAETKSPVRAPFPQAEGRDPGPRRLRAQSVSVEDAPGPTLQHTPTLVYSLHTQPGDPQRQKTCCFHGKNVLT